MKTCGAVFIAASWLGVVTCERGAGHDGPHKGASLAPGCTSPIIWSEQWAANHDA